ncbi:MAG TPA: hypothetical protein VL793_10475 [Patescibacteria group bacterium]|nr:hypothetical protein [Patescibacteria group bacterium]
MRYPISEGGFRMQSPCTMGLLSLLTFAVVGLANPKACATDFLPPDRSTVWEPGIPGGIPNRTVIYTTIQASTYGNGTVDATAGIQSALDSCPAGQVVLLSAGNFKITSRLELTKGIVLRGQGPTQTKLKMPEGTNSNVITIGTQWFGHRDTVNLAANAVKGTYAVTLASNPGLSDGEHVIIDALSDPNITSWSVNSPPGDPSRGWFCRTNRPVGQVLEIQSVTGNLVTFTTPFHIDFKTAFTAQLSRFAQWDNGPLAPTVEFAGVEDLYVSGGSQGQGNIWLSGAAYCWIKNIESDRQNGRAVDLISSFRCVVRDSYIHSTQDPNPGGGGYGLSLGTYSSDNLIENNIVWNMNKVMVMPCSGGGNVIGYNYLEDGWISYATNWVESGLNAAHMTTAHFELFEGNEAFNFDGENTWGGAVYITVFRNHFTGQRRSIAPLSLTDEGNRKAVGIGKGHWWYTIVGNVLGTAGQTPAPAASFVYEDFYPWDSDPAPMWRLGFDTNDWNATADAKVISTLIRGGNYDYFTKTVHWENLPAQTLPDSLYLKAKPAFFGTKPWPWVDPTGAVPVQSLPARDRFDTIHGIAVTNTAPVVDAGPNRTITLPASASLDGTVSDDGFPNPPANTTVTWSKVAGPGTATFANAGAVDTTATFSVAGSYTLRLSASDGVLSASDTMTVTVNASANAAPVITSGITITPDPVVNQNFATLAVTASDPDSGPQALKYDWSKSAGPGTVTFSPDNTSGSNLTTATFSASGTYTVSVTVNDGDKSVSDTHTITVTLPASGTPGGTPGKTRGGCALSGNPSDRTEFPVGWMGFVLGWLVLGAGRRCIWKRF